tara:strand:+ start:851 stop:955 length:105 start_codon:yes stop_codon:yes gene_type:complete
MFQFSDKFFPKNMFNKVCVTVNMRGRNISMPNKK